jgi:hypothetical protein
MCVDIYTKDNNLSTGNHSFEIEERRRQVAKFMARGNMTQTQIAQQLGSNQSTISDDVKALKEMSQHFIYDLAKSDLAHYFKQSIDGIEDVKAEAWSIYVNGVDLSVKDRLDALKLIIQANEAKFRLISEGPNVMAMRQMEERITQIEDEQREEEQS